mgnify:CR=1 FL=1
MELNNYYQEIDNQGVKQVITDYNKAILNSELMNVITKVNGLMAERGFPLKDLSASLRSLQNQSAEDAMLMGKEGAEINETPIDKLKAVAKADIIRMFFLSLAGSTPVDIAKSSPPRARVFRSQEYLMRIGNTIPKTTPTNSTVSRSGRLTLPNDQCVNWANCCGVAK